MPEETKPRIRRKKLSARSKGIRVRLTESEMKKLKKMSEESGKTMSDILRTALKGEKE